MSANVTDCSDVGLMRCGLIRGITFSIRHIMKISAVKNRIAITGSQLSAEVLDFLRERHLRRRDVNRRRVRDRRVAYRGVCHRRVRQRSMRGRRVCERGMRGSLMRRRVVRSRRTLGRRARHGADLRAHLSILSSETTILGIGSIIRTCQALVERCNYVAWGASRECAARGPCRAVSRTRDRARRCARRRRGSAAQPAAATGGAAGRSRTRRTREMPGGSGASR